MAPAKIRTYVETGTKRAFAGAIEWPGWCRAGRDPDSALEALFDYRTRYAKTLRGTRLGFEPPAGPAAFVVVERLKGDATTDFGAPSIAPTADERRITDAELARLRSILNACWRSFDGAVDAARGKVLAKAARRRARSAEDRRPRRGRRRELPADARSEGRGRPEGGTARSDARAILDALATTARDGVPPPGPRGGKRWLPRYFVRRVAWHVLDHAWEIEDRIT